MHTVSQLARRLGLSRSTLLYYERVGLLRPDRRGANGYRLYSQEQEERGRQIVSLRALGLPVAEIVTLLDGADEDLGRAIMRSHLERLEREIGALRRQQLAIVGYLGQREPKEETVIDKKRWVEIMRAAGLGEDDMHGWHREFERMEPEAHQEFLESLGIDADEIARIREHARS